MGDVVNLKRFKKRAVRDQAAKDADERRVRFGRSKTERRQQQDETRKLDSVLDGHRLDKDQA
jgi:Domain of unknown function (DUF4169)